MVKVNGQASATKVFNKYGAVMSNMKIKIVLLYILQKKGRNKTSLFFNAQISQITI